MKTSWYLYRKINFKLLIDNQLCPARRVNISKKFGYLFFSALGSKLNISTLSILVFLLLQKFKFALHVRYCCVIRAWSSDFNSSFYLQSWIDSVHQSHAAGASLGKELIGLSSLGAGDFILSGFVTSKICHMSSYERTMVTKTVHQLQLLQFSKSDDRSPTMAGVIAIYQKQLTRSAQWILLQEIHPLSDFIIIAHQDFIQPLLSTAVLPQIFSFLTVCLVQWLRGVAPW